MYLQGELRTRNTTLYRAGIHRLSTLGLACFHPVALEPVPVGRYFLVSASQTLLHFQALFIFQSPMRHALFQLLTQKPLFLTPICACLKIPGAEEYTWKYQIK